jgi:hypothetical protein
MSRAAAPSRQPSSSRGGWLAHQERGLPAAQRGSQADPTGFHLDAAHQAAQNGVYWLTRPGTAPPLGTPTLSLAGKDQGRW